MSRPDEGNPPERGRGGRPSRFGPSAIIREGPASEDAHLLHLFVSGSETVARERRRSPRLPAVERCAWLGWWDDVGGFTTVAACLENISLGGAKLRTSVPPPIQQIVWLCVGVPHPTECVQAKVLAVTPTPEGDSAVRLAFGIPCPENFYRVAIGGLDAEAEGIRSA